MTTSKYPALRKVRPESPDGFRAAGKSRPTCRGVDTLSPGREGDGGEPEAPYLMRWPGLRALPLRGIQLARFPLGLAAASRTPKEALWSWQDI